MTPDERDALIDLATAYGLAMHKAGAGGATAAEYRAWGDFVTALDVLAARSDQGRQG